MRKLLVIVALLCLATFGWAGCKGKEVKPTKSEKAVGKEENYKVSPEGGDEEEKVPVRGGRGVDIGE